MKTNSKLVPILALHTSFGYQLKVKEAPGSKYARGENTGNVLSQCSYYTIQLEDMGQDKQQEYPELMFEILLNEDELVALYGGLKSILKDKGY